MERTFQSINTLEPQPEVFIREARSTSMASLGKGSKKNKKQLWKIPLWVWTPSPPGYGKKKIIFFLKLDHFLRTFCKKCIFTIENPKKLRKFFKK